MNRILSSSAAAIAASLLCSLPSLASDVPNTPSSDTRISSGYTHAAQLRSPVFDSGGVIRSVSVNIYDDEAADDPSCAYIAVYDENGALSGMAGSSGRIYDPSVSNIMTLTFDTDLAVRPTDTYKIFFWSCDGGAITMFPYAGAYSPADAGSYLITGENGGNTENFVYSGADYNGLSELTQFNGWEAFGSAGRDLRLWRDGAVSYARIRSYGTDGSGDPTSLYVFKELSSDIGCTGTYMIDTDIKYSSGGGLDFGFTDGYSADPPFIADGSGFTAFTIGTDGSVSIGNTQAGQLDKDRWTNIKYILNMDTGTASVSVAGGAPAEAVIPGYTVNTVPSPEKFTSFVIGGAGSAFDVGIASLTAAKLSPRPLPGRTVTARIADGSSGSGTVTIDGEAVMSKTAPQSTIVRLSAIPADNSVFTGWFDMDGELLSRETEFRYRLFGDLTVYAYFIKKSGAGWVADYSVCSDKGLVKANVGELCTLYLDNVTDANGLPAIAENTDAEWSCGEPGITVSQNGVVSLGSGFEIAENTAKDIVIQASLNDIERSYTLTVYSYDFYENCKDGRPSADWSGTVAEAAGRSALAFPKGGGVSVLMLPSAVPLDEPKTISFTAAVDAESSLCAQARYIEFYDSNGDKVVSDLIGYSWFDLYVGGTPAKDEIVSPKHKFTGAITPGEWSDEVAVTIDRAAGTAEVSFGGASVSAELNASAADIASVGFISHGSAPGPAERALAVSGIIIK